MRRALAAGSNAGIKVSVDATTQLAVVPFAGRFPPPLTQCEVLAPCQYRTRLHPLSVNSTKDERVHYVDHTVDAPAMMLEHLTDQYWFPYFGLLVSQQGQVWRHSYLGPFQDGFLTRVKAIVDRPLPDGSERAPALSGPAQARSQDHRASIFSSPAPTSRITATTCSTSFP